MVRVLFVCLGNICRSPMAEAIFRHKVLGEGLQDHIEVDSAGTGNWHIGKPPHQGTQAILDREHIPFEGMKARQLQQKDWSSFDYMIAMDDQNVRNLHLFFDQKEGPVIKKLMEFVAAPEEKDVPDPYYTGDFDYTYQLVSNGCNNLLKYIKENHRI